MSKRNLARLLLFVASATTGCAAVLSSDTRLFSFVMIVAAGLLSLLALIVALRKPRQPIVGSLAALLTLVHVGFWVWIEVIHFTGL
ncbi:MAG TPA: hypothetical protein VJ853_11965 [Thermoanaerobaculia bacterium]|nr:hypothetical protein [Thermoanaerobaculia bacterium]